MEHVKNKYRIHNIWEQPLISLFYSRNKSMLPLIKGATQAAVQSLIPTIRRHKVIKRKAQSIRNLKALKVSAKTITMIGNGLIQETVDQDPGIASQNLGKKNIETGDQGQKRGGNEIGAMALTYPPLKSFHNLCNEISY